MGIRQASLFHHFAAKEEILLEPLHTSVRPVSPSSTPCWRTRTRRSPATPYNIGTLYPVPEVQQPESETFRGHRSELQTAYTSLAGPAFAGVCRTVEQVPTACLRVIGTREAALARIGPAGRRPAASL